MADTLRLDMDGTDRLSPKLENIEKHLKSVHTAANNAQNMLSTIMGVVGGVVVGKIGGAAVDLAKSIIEAGEAMDGYRARLTTVLGTQRRVNEAMASLVKFAKDTPFTLSEATDAFVRMSAYGLDPTIDKMKIVGDFASSMGRSFTDAVEAVADATRGEFERMKEFGLSKEAVAALGQNLVNAKGQIVNHVRFVDALFKGMSMRAKGAMQNMMNTPQGRASNLDDAVLQAKLRIYNKISASLMNFYTILTRLVERLTSGGLLDKIGEMAEKAFSVKNMKAFATVAYGVFKFMKDFFTGDLVDGIKVITGTLELFFAKLTNGLTNISNKLSRFFVAIQAAMNGPWNKMLPAIGEAFGHLQGRDPGAEALQQAKMIPTQASTIQAMERIKARAKARGANDGFIDSLFAGLTDTKFKPSDGAGANFGGAGAGDAGKSALDKITEMILGGGVLAKLGIKPSELGGDFKFLNKDKSIQVDVSGGGSRTANQFYKDLFDQFLADAIRSGKVAVVGGH